MINTRVQSWLTLGLWIILGLYIYAVFNLALVNDDYMALYSTWLMSTGKVPGVNFNIDSYTLLFDLMVPIYSLTGEHFSVVYMFRLIFLLLLCIISWQTYRLIRVFFSKNIALLSLLLLFSSYAMVARGIDLRPDLVILLLWLQILIVLYVQRHRAKKTMFLVGLLLALAMSFKFKAILICPVIALYGLMHWLHTKSLQTPVKDGLVCLSGILAGLGLVAVLIGLSSFRQFIETSWQLMFYSAGHTNTGDANSLKLSVILRYFLRDIFYWLLFLSGIVIAWFTRQSLSKNQKLCLGSLFLLAILSVAANPHYHAYNLTTLYPLVAVFVAFSLHFIGKLTHSRNSIGCIIVSVLTVLLFRAGHYVFVHNLSHQKALQSFIEQETPSNSAVFAYEGIGLFRPSTFHWRTSAIKQNNYVQGDYNVWQEIQSEKPLLIIENYRIPGWLIAEDRHQLYQHYVSLTPLLLVLGLTTESSVSGELLRSGWYTVNNKHKNACHIDGNPLNDGEKIWLEGGTHHLSTSSGLCTLRWYFPADAIVRLEQSNPLSKPYLYPPNW